MKTINFIPENKVPDGIMTAVRKEYNEPGFTFSPYSYFHKEEKVYGIAIYKDGKLWSLPQATLNEWNKIITN
jgi:hypothetical protein